MLCSLNDYGDNFFVLFIAKNSLKYTLYECCKLPINTWKVTENVCYDRFFCLLISTEKDSLTEYLNEQPPSYNGILIKAKSYS